MKVIKYKTFSNDEEFTKFQLEDNPHILQIQPIMTGLNMDTEASDESAKSSADTSMGVFVTFMVEIEN